MKKEELFEIIGEVDEQKVLSLDKTVNSRKKSHYGFMKWVAIAASLCVVATISISWLNSNKKSDKAVHDGLDFVQNPVYDVVEYTVPQSYEFTNLYVSTTDDLDEYDTYIAERYGEKFRGKGIRVFTFVEGTTTTDFNVWYFDYEGTSISRIYYVTKSPKSPDKMIIAWTEAGECSKAIESLSSKTSTDTPMYLVQDNETLYAVIGKTAYYLPDTVWKPKVSQMPEINTEGLNTVVIDVTE